MYLIYFYFKHFKCYNNTLYNKMERTICFKNHPSLRVHPVRRRTLSAFYYILYQHFTYYQSSFVRNTFIILFCSILYWSFFSDVCIGKDHILHKPFYFLPFEIDQVRNIRAWDASPWTRVLFVDKSPLQKKVWSQLKSKNYKEFAASS